MLLGGRQRIVPAGLGQLEAAAEPGRIRGPQLERVELLRRSDDSREYLTLDRWVSRAAYEAFRSRFSSEYRRLDERLVELTEVEAPLGAFEVLP